METIVFNLTGNVRRVVEGGKEWLVAPLSMISPGVLPGSKGPLLYTPKDVAANAKKWNKVPIVLYHPTDPRTGEHVSASAEGVWDRQGLGEVRNARFAGKLRGEGWFDAAKTRQTAPDVYAALVSGKPMEISTGLYTRGPDKEGVYNGRSYQGVAQHQEPDHLAILPTQTGACSVRDGCGLNVNAAEEWQTLNGSTGDAQHDAMMASIREKGEGSGPESHGRITKGQTVRFEGKSADGTYEGGSDVKVINPHSNAHEVAFSKGGRDYDKTGKTHIPTATVERPARKRLSGETVPAKRFEAHHFTLHPAKATRNANAAWLAYNRDWPQSKRDKLDDSDFAGPDQSFPIQSQADVDSAAHLIGKAANPDAVKARIKSIAKRKGLTVPEAWTENSNPEGHNQYTGGGGGRFSHLPADEHISQAYHNAKTLTSEEHGEAHKAIEGASKEELHSALTKMDLRADKTASKGKLAGMAKQFLDARHGMAQKVAADRGHPMLNQRGKIKANDAVIATFNGMGSGNHGLAKRAAYANQCTDNADAATEAAQSSQEHEAAADLHDEAAEAHTRAMTEAASASATRAESDYSAAGYHQVKAQYHKGQAENHRGMVNNDDEPMPTDTTPASTTPDMGTTPMPAMNRQQRIAYLVANCACSPFEEVLNEYDDDKLEEFHRMVLVANAATQGFTEGGKAFRVNPATGKWERKKATTNRFGGDEKGASKEAAMASVHAGGDGRESALQAMDAAKEGNSKKAANLHNAAAKNHDADALAARKDGDEAEANLHDNAAAQNRKAASCHAATMNKANGHKANQPGKRIMLNPRKYLRQLAVNGLVTQEEYKALSAHSDKVLGLLLNKKKKDKEEDDMDDEDDDEIDDNMVKQDADRHAGDDIGYKSGPGEPISKPTGNSMKKWLASAPPQAKEIWNGLVENQNREHASLVEQLTANFDGEEQAALRREYSRIPLERLRIIARAQLGQQVSNGFVMPTYLGAAGGGYAAPTENAGIEGMDPDAIRAAANAQYTANKKTA